jgi:hypothetical protein
MSDPKTLIINLKIIGSLDSGIKLNTREKYFTLDNVNWYQGLRRFYRRDDRSVTYEKISYLIRNVQDLLQSLTDGPRSLGLENETQLREYLSPILEDAQRGLRSLQLTYEEDKTFTSQIDVEIATIDRILGPNRPNRPKIPKLEQSIGGSSFGYSFGSSDKYKKSTDILKGPFEKPSHVKRPKLTGNTSPISFKNSLNETETA